MSCGCFQKSQARLAHLLRPYESLYNRIKNYSKGRYAVEISYEEFLEFTKINKCHYCDYPIIWARDNVKKNGYAYNLDRKDNSIGYTKDNCVVCCKRCNIAKFNHFTYEEWKRIGEFIKTWNQ